MLAFGALDMDSSESYISANKLAKYFSFKDPISVFLIDFRNDNKLKYRDNMKTSQSIETSVYDFIENW